MRIHWVNYRSRTTIKKKQWKKQISYRENETFWILNFKSNFLFKFTFSFKLNSVQLSCILGKLLSFQRRSKKWHKTKKQSYTETREGIFKWFRILKDQEVELDNVWFRKYIFYINCTIFYHFLVLCVSHISNVTVYAKKTSCFRAATLWDYHHQSTQKQKWFETGFTGLSSTCKTGKTLNAKLSKLEFTSFHPSE